LLDENRRNGVYVGCILKGEKAAGVHIDHATKFVFVINLIAAKTLRLTMPGMLLARADDVIE
jgi:ABC-type uncharacterized transport system substrate-binding protein